jgi:hypothetical protein
MNQLTRKTLVLAALVGTTAACQDLEVTNLNLPDTERALSSPDAVQAVIESSFTIWWGRMHNAGDSYNYYPELADELTRTWQVRGVQSGFEPRLPLNNDPEAPSVWLPRTSWDGFASGTANNNDAIRVIQNGLRIVVADAEGEEVSDQTDRALVFARVWQGINLGYLALVHDQAAPADETTVIADPVAWERDNLTPWDQIIPMAVGHLEKAIDRATTGEQWTLSPSFINQQGYNNQEMIEFAHTMIARLMVYSARTPEQRAAVDWDKVRFHAERGLTFDFGPVLQSGVITSTGFGQRAHGGWASTNTAFFRVDPRIIGMTDVSGGYQEWLALSRDERDSWEIDSPDRRVQGPAGPGDLGAYIRPGASNIIVDRGTYNRSLYALWRRSNDPAVVGRQWDNSMMPIATADENRLYLAEAHLRLGNLAQAASLLNETRTRSVTIAGQTVAQGLPPLTASGVPQSADCVPRANFGMAPAGQCGTLEDALFYERAIELMGLDPYRAWMDYRGFGFLQAGTQYHMPVPGRYLVSIGLPVYSFGGVGGDGAAVGPPGPFGSN